MDLQFMKQSHVQRVGAPLIGGVSMALAGPVGLGSDGHTATCTEVRNSNPSGVRESIRVSQWAFRMEILLAVLFNKSIMSLFMISIIAFMMSCQHQGNDNTQATVAKIESSIKTDTEFTKSFPEYGFSIKAPCKLEDVSAHSSGDFLLNLGGVTDGNDMQKMAAYQFIVTRLPIGYKKFSKTELTKKVDDILRQQTSHLNNVEAIKVGYEEFPGYVGYTMHQGLRQKGMMFAVDNYIIAMTVMTNNNLETKFNKFSNSFKIIK